MIGAETLKAAAPGLGFIGLGFSRAEPVDPTWFRAWLAAGNAGCNHDLHARQPERFNPEILLPGAKTIISAACCFTQTAHARPSAIARHARGRDYHGLVQDRMRRLRRLLLTLDPEVETYTSVDAGPVLEKHWAARSGLGWIGKNTLLVTPDHGSRVVLAAMVIDREVDRYDTPIPDRCGSCTRCLDGCPTGALFEPGILDARRCLSSETTAQRHEPFSPALRPFAGPYAFGCDACQDDCPWNRADHACNDPKFAPRPFAALSLQELVALTPEAHREAIQGTAVVRARYDGLRRNALVALVRQGCFETEPPLAQLALDEKAPLTAEIAQWAVSLSDSRHF